MKDLFEWFCVDKLALGANKTKYQSNNNEI